MDCTSNIIPFRFDCQEVRTILIDECPWFVGKDVCDILDLSNPSVAVDSLDSDERAKFNLGRSSIHGGGGEINIISESGLYALIFKSRKPEAKKFRKWVTSEVLPTLRRTGRYEAGGREVVSSFTPQVINVQATGLVTLRLTPDGQGSFSLEVNYRTPGKGLLANGKKQNAIRFLMDTVEESAYSSIQACCLYDEYYRWCERHDYLALNNITFGKVVFQLFPGVHRSRQWVDQSSRGYFYAGLDYRQPDAASPPPAAKPWVEGEL